MSINFRNPMNDEVSSKLTELFKEQITARDERTVLLDGLQEMDGAVMSDLARTAKQPISYEMHETDDIKEVGGVKYKVTTKGWVKI